MTSTSIWSRATSSTNGPAMEDTVRPREEANADSRVKAAAVVNDERNFGLSATGES
jgi:hypothetical protein